MLPVFKNKLFLSGLIIFLASFLLFLPNINDGFLSDDYDFLARMDGVKNWSSAWAQINPGNQFFWRPILNTSFLLNYLIFGEHSAVSYHLFNNLAHALVALLVFLIVWEWWRKLDRAILAGLFFGVYPMHHESVTWIAGRTDVLAALFFVAAWYCFMLFLRGAKSKFWWALVLCGVAFITKEAALGLPAVLFGVDVIWFGRKKIKYYILTYGPFAILYLLYFCGRYFSIGTLVGGYQNASGIIALHLPISQVLASPFFYLTKMINYPFWADGFSWTSGWGQILFTARKWWFLFLPALILLFIQWRNNNRSAIKDLPALYILVLLATGPAWSLMAGIDYNGSDSRFIYIPTIIGSMVLGYLLTPNFLNNTQRKIVRIVSGLAMVFFVFAFFVNYIPWAEAARVNMVVEKDLPIIYQSVVPGTMIYVTNLPDNYFGAYIFRNGFYELAENTLRDESLSPSAYGGTFWQMKSADKYGGLCPAWLKPAGDLLVWDKHLEKLVRRSDLLDRLNTTTVFAIDEKLVKNQARYKLLVWNNQLWSGEEKFVISFPKDLPLGKVAASCPLWRISQ